MIPLPEDTIVATLRGQNGYVMQWGNWETQLAEHGVFAENERWCRFDVQITSDWYTVRAEVETFLDNIASLYDDLHKLYETLDEMAQFGAVYGAYTFDITPATMGLLIVKGTLGKNADSEERIDYTFMTDPTSLGRFCEDLAKLLEKEHI